MLRGDGWVRVWLLIVGGCILSSILRDWRCEVLRVGLEEAEGWKFGLLVRAQLELELDLVQAV